MNISILGSTGSIGKQTLEVVKHLNTINVVGLSTNTNIELLKQQIEQFSPQAVAVIDAAKADELEDAVEIPVYKGIEGLNTIATLQEAETVVTSVVGSIGLLPTLQAINAKKNIALANKETLVCGGELVMNAVKKHKVQLRPIDSEHSALWQCLDGKNMSEIKKLIITCSGGPFKDYTLEQLKKVTLYDALKHPTWNMGAKITIDSATLMNKGLEVIEAHWLYGVDYENIEVVIHPQSTIHSMVEYCDGSILAQLSLPDMKLPIQYALTYPKRHPSLQKSLDWRNMTLNFSLPDLEKFPCLRYAYNAGKTGGTMPTVLNAANEVVVDLFLKNKISFVAIAQKIKEILDAHMVMKHPEIEDILRSDAQTRKQVIELQEN